MLMSDFQQISLNAGKTKYLFFHKPSAFDSIPLRLSTTTFSSIEIKRESSVKFIGVIIDENITWNKHIEFVENKISKNIAILYRASRNVHKKKSKKHIFLFIISQEQYSFPKLTLNQLKSLSSIGISNTGHLSTISITPTTSSTSLQNTKLTLTSASDTTSLSTLKSSQNVKIEDSTLTQLSTMFNNCSIKESNIAEENKFEGIHQLPAQIAAISDDVDYHIDENPIEDI